MVNFGNSERHILSLFSVGGKFTFDNDIYEVLLSGKPTTTRGEPKTDIYVLSESTTNGNRIEFKISFKQENADFLENKMTADRASQIFGPNWQNIISHFTKSIEASFTNRPLIYKVSYARTNEGSITLGWRFELVNKSGGDLSGLANLTPEQVFEVYSGSKLADSKKHAKVNGQIINNSGVANCIISANIDSINNIQDAVNSLLDLKIFANQNPNVYFVCKALNYRSFEKKIEGNRALSVFVRWEAENGELTPYLEFNNPLNVGGKEVKEKLEDTLNKLEVRNTNDITPNNVSSWNLVKY